MLGGMDVDELQHALGAIVLESAYLERVLRAAFSALVGSKYAAVIDGRWPASALIEDCEQIVKYPHRHSGAGQGEAGRGAKGLPRGEQATQPGDPRRMGNQAG
jgi:hypothetical protein